MTVCRYELKSQQTTFAYNINEGLKNVSYSIIKTRRCGDAILNPNAYTGSYLQKTMQIRRECFAMSDTTDGTRCIRPKRVKCPGI